MNLSLTKAVKDYYRNNESKINSFVISFKKNSRSVSILRDGIINYFLDITNGWYKSCPGAVTKRINNLYFYAILVRLYKIDFELIPYFGLPEVYAEFVRLVNDKKIPLSTITDHMHLFVTEMMKKTECIICIDSIGKKEFFICDKCNHVCHSHCINQWLWKRDATSKPICFFCQQDLV